MKINEFNGNLNEGTETVCVAIPTEPQDIKILEFNQFIRKINDPEQIVYARVYLEIKKQFLASHKFNNAKNKINLTNKHLYKSYKKSLVVALKFFNEFKKDKKEIKRMTDYGKNRLGKYFQENK